MQRRHSWREETDRHVGNGQRGPVPGPAVFRRSPSQTCENPGTCFVLYFSTSSRHCTFTTLRRIRRILRYNLSTAYRADGARFSLFPRIPRWRERQGVYKIENWEYSARVQNWRGGQQTSRAIVSLRAKCLGLTGPWPSLPLKSSFGVAIFAAFFL